MLKLFRKFKKADVGLIIAAIAFVFVVVWAELTMPEYMSEITTLVQTEGSEMSDILTAGGKMLLYALVSLGASIVVSICASRLSTSFGATLRKSLFHKVQDFSMAEIGQFSGTSLIMRTTNDVMQVQMLIVLGLQMLIKAPVMAIWAILKISNQAWQWTLSTAIAVIILLCVVFLCIGVATPKFRKMQSLTDNLNRVTRENLTGLQVVRAYNAEDYQKEKFEKANTEITDTTLFAQRTMGKAGTGETDMLSEDGHVFVAEQQAIQEFARRGRGIFVGHCAAEALRNEPRVARVFIRCSDETARKARIMEQYGIQEAVVESTRKHYDRKRANILTRIQGRNGRISKITTSYWIPV